MAIVNKSLMAAASQFSDHLNDIFNKTLTLVRVVPIGRAAPGRPPEQITLTLGQNGSGAPLRTRFGPANSR